MSLRDQKYDDFDAELRRSAGQGAIAGEPDQSGVSPQHTKVDTDQPTVTSDIRERQAVEVRPMRYVLGIGIALAIVAMAAVWLLLR